MGPTLDDDDDDDDDDTRGSSSFVVREEQSRFQKNTIASNDLILKTAANFCSRAGSTMTGPLSSPSEGVAYTLVLTKQVGARAANLWPTGDDPSSKS